MKTPEQVVFVLDDDPSMRTAIKELIEAVGMSCQTFGSGQELLEAELPDVPRSLVLDVRLPGLSGLNLQRELNERGIHMPIIFITGHGDIDVCPGHESRGSGIPHSAVSGPGLARCD